MLDHVPARLRIIRICRPRYGCRACGTIHQAPAPERPIAKGLASPALLAHVLVSKYCDHTPLYRQTQIFAAAVYFYSPDRKAERPAAHLQDFRGVLQVDGYAGFERLTAPGDIVLAACWAHARRKFYDLNEATGSPIAAEALRRIAELYAIERSIKGCTADARRHVRNTSARPLIEMMKP